MTLGINYNERSWAIDLISHIQQVAMSNNRSIKGAGGEQTIEYEGGNLYPDILLFGDISNAVILQGWELKMPDTSIDNYEFRNNSRRKAIALGLNSFILWNVSYAHLYIREPETDEFHCVQKWDELAFITNRTSVQPNSQEWKNLATKLISYMNDLFDRGKLQGRQFIDAYRSGGVTSFLMENTAIVANALKNAAYRSSMLNSQITLWWERYKSEYTKNQQRERILAQANLSNWVGKLIFAHIIQGQDIAGQDVTKIDSSTTPDEALDIFQTLCDTCNFWTVFSDNIGLSVIPESAWRQLKEFNKLLTDLRIGSIDQSQLSQVLEAMVDVSVQKFRGQYSTPTTLARLLVRLTVNNIFDDRVLDPCCGSGTIARLALEQKLDAGVSPAKASQTVFAGDLDHQAIQIATFALANPSLMRFPLRIFHHDAFSLDPDTPLE